MIDRSKVADVVDVVVISTRICFVEQPEESLGFFVFVLGCFWESKKTIEARKINGKKMRLK